MRERERERGHGVLRSGRDDASRRRSALDLWLFAIAMRESGQRGADSQNTINRILKLCARQLRPSPFRTPTKSRATDTLTNSATSFPDPTYRALATEPTHNAPPDHDRPAFTSGALARVLAQSCERGNTYLSDSACASSPCLCPCRGLFRRAW